MSSADVTVIIPARNSEDTIATTIRSIGDQQGGPPVIIVVDDGSTDSTVDVAKRSGATVISQPWSGPGAARNTGITATSTPLLAFCDADDTWPPTRLADDLEILRTYPEVEVVLGRTRFDADDEDLLRGHHFDRDDRSAIIPHFGAATVRRHVFDTTGHIDASMTNYEDYDWFLRIREVGVKVRVHDRISLHRRIHRASTSQLNPGGPAELLAVLHKSVRRRRTSGAAEIPQLSQLTDIDVNGTKSKEGGSQ